VVDVAGLAHAEREPGNDDDRKRSHEQPEHAGDDTRGERARVSVVIPVWNGRRWLDGCLESIARQSEAVHEVIAVDNGSADGSVACLRASHPDVRVVELGTNTGFAHAVNQGIRCAAGDYVALLNTDVVLAPDWVARMVAALSGDPGAAAVACKMVELARPDRIYDAGDVLRRDGVCEQRGRFRRDDGAFDAPGEVFGACAGAALYRREAVLAVGGFDERYFAYLEDVDLALALRLAGWRCLYEPAVAHHAGEGSSGELPGGHRRLVTRNSVVLVAKWFPARWLPYVAYRQLAWAWHALRERRLSAHLRALAAAGPMLPGVLRARRARRHAVVAVRIEAAIPPRPWRGPRAEGHPSRHAARR
jgi:GT2 family glycosyltransferase